MDATVALGAAAINRTWKRGVILQWPFVQRIGKTRDRRNNKKGADITLANLRAVYRGSNTAQ